MRLGRALSSTGRRSALSVSCESSRADIEMTKQIVAAGKPLGVIVHDHIIVGKKGHANLRGLGLI